MDITLAQISDIANLGYEDPNAVEYYLVNEGSVNIGTPENPIDPQETYNNVNYVPEMFCNDYQLIGGDDAIAEFAKESEYFEYKQYDAIYEKYTTQDLTVLPYRIAPCDSYDVPNISDVDFYHWIKLYMRSWDNNLSTLICAYDVEENKLMLRPVQEANYDKDSSTKYYEFGDVILEYEFVFRGTTLTLSKDGQSVTLNAGYIYGTEENPRLYADSYLSQGSAEIDNIIGFSILWDDEKGENNRFHVIFEDRDSNQKTSYKCVGRISEDGLFTFTVPYDQELKYRAEEKTYQFVYFLYDDNKQHDGLILSDGEQTYFYTAGYFDYQNYKDNETVQ